MARPVRSRTKGLFLDSLAEDFSNFEVKVLKKGTTRKRTAKSDKERDIKVTLPKDKSKPKASKAKPKDTFSERQFKYRLDNKLFNEFVSKDWHLYWQHKAKEQGIDYLVLKGQYIKDYAIINSLMKNLTVEDIKLSMDFLWECNHDLHEKATMGLWILSKGWVNTVYQSALLWRDGRYKTRAEQNKESYKTTSNKRNREWIRSSSNSETGKKNTSKISI